MPLVYLWLLPIGLGAGLLGTMIGTGGGFLLVPILLLLYPHESPETITSISLAVVAANAISGTIAYARMKRIDYFSGIIFAVATIPGAIAGALTTSAIPRQQFNLLFGVAMVAACIFLLVRPLRPNAAAPTPREGTLRSMLDAQGRQISYAYDLKTGVYISLMVGFVSSLLGIGGGIMHVPLLVYVLDFPVHIATATSQSVLAVTATTGTIVHILNGSFEHGVRRAIILGIGVFIGAQIGARLSRRVQAQVIIRVLAVGLGLAGVRILLLAITVPAG